MFNSLFNLFKAFKNLISYLFKNYPVLLYLFVICILNFCVIVVTTETRALVLYSLGIAIFSIVIYAKTGKFGESALSLFFGLISVFTLEWKYEKAALFAQILFPSLFIYFIIDSIKLSGKSEEILTQAAIFIDYKRVQEIYKELDNIAKSPTESRQLGVIERSEIVRFLAFHKIPTKDMRSVIEIVEFIKTTYLIDLDLAISTYWSLFNIVKKVENRSILNRDLYEILNVIATVPISPKEYADCIIRNRTEFIKNNYTVQKINESISDHISKGFRPEDFIPL